MLWKTFKELYYAITPCLWGQQWFERAYSAERKKENIIQWHACMTFIGDLTAMSTPTTLHLWLALLLYSLFVSPCLPCAISCMMKSCSRRQIAPLCLSSLDMMLKSCWWNSIVIWLTVVKTFMWVFLRELCKPI